MKKTNFLEGTFFIYFLLGIFFTSFGQDKSMTEIQSAYENENFELIISTYAKEDENYSALDYFYIGMAYYINEDDENCLKYMKLSIEKDSLEPAAHFMKGVTQSFLGDFENAIPSLNKAIELDSTSSNYYSALGDALFNNKNYIDAVEAYKTSINKENPTERSFAMLAQSYLALNDSINALKYLYVAKDNISPTNDSYLNTLYNIGLFEYFNKNYESAEKAYKELLRISPDDFLTYSKLIQVYYGVKDYDKAEPYRQKLYQAQSNKKLEGYLGDMFCFDQFYWNGKLVQAFERYETGDTKLYYKRLFFLIDDKGEIVVKIQSENSPIAIQLKEAKYVLGTDFKGTHYNWNIWYDEDFKYEDMKKGVIYILDNELKTLIKE